MGTLEGKVAIITGAAAGIGAATAARLAEDGARVVVADINAEGAERQAQCIKDAGGDAIGVVTDIADEESIRALVDATVATYGGIDILHNNASAMDLTVRDGAVGDLELEVFDGTIRTNLRGTLVTSKLALPHILARGGGSIVNTASDQALVGDTGQTSYAAAKMGVIALTRSLATQYGRQWLRCNAICPGLIMSDRLKEKLTGEYLDRLIAHHLLPRAGEPIDIAHMVRFLVSDEGSFITGQVISVDGGMLAHMPSYASGGNIIKR